MYLSIVLSCDDWASYSWRDDYIRKVIDTLNEALFARLFSYLQKVTILQVLIYSLSFVLLAACASIPEFLSPPSNLDENPYGKLYEGKSETVFSTLFPPATVIEAINLGDAAASTGNYDEALFRYVQALYIDDSIPETFYKIGVIHTIRSSYELAKLAYVQALIRQQDYAIAMEALGLTQLKLQEYSAAEATLIEARSLLPQSWRILNSLGIIEDINKNYTAAQKLYKQAISINPELPEMQINLGYSMYLGGDYKPAIDIFNKLLAKDSSQKRGWMNLGLAYFKTEQYKNAVNAFNQVVSLADAYNNVGYLCFLQAQRNPQSETVGDLIDTARAYFDLAIKQSVKYHAEAEKNLQDLNEWALTEQRF
jgi:tetratricopeptide (TPR) repeat protein